MINEIQFSGHLGQNAKANVAKGSGKEYVSFSLCNSNKNGKSTWVQVMYFGDNKDYVAAFTKGDEVYVRGVLSVSEYNGQTSVTVIANIAALLKKAEPKTEQEPLPESVLDDLPF